MIRALAFVGILLFAMAGVAHADCPAGKPTPAGGCGLSDLTPVTTPGLTDSTFWCQPSVEGCKSTDAVVTLKQVSFGTLIGFIKSQITASPPIVNLGGNLTLQIDPTLSVVNGQLHVVSAGGGGGVGGPPITGLTQDVLATGPGTVPATVVGLQGRPMSNVPPGSGQCLGWNGSVWLPVACGGGGGGGGITNISQGPGITLSPNPITSTGTVATSGNTTQLTSASFCVGSGCTPGPACLTYTAGVLTAFATGSCSGAPGNRMLIQTGSALLIQTGSNLLIQ